MIRGQRWPDDPEAHFSASLDKGLANTIPDPAELRERGVRIYRENRADYASDTAANKAIAPKLSCSPDSLRVRRQQTEHNAGPRGGLTTAEKDRIKVPESEVRETAMEAREDAAGVVLAAGEAISGGHSAIDPDLAVEVFAGLEMAATKNNRKAIATCAKRLDDPTPSEPGGLIPASPPGPAAETGCVTYRCPRNMLSDTGMKSDILAKFQIRPPQPGK